MKHVSRIQYANNRSTEFHKTRMTITKQMLTIWSLHPREVVHIIRRYTTVHREYLRHPKRLQYCFLGHHSGLCCLPAPLNTLRRDIVLITLIYAVHVCPTRNNYHLERPWHWSARAAKSSRGYSNSWSCDT